MSLRVIPNEQLKFMLFVVVGSVINVLLLILMVQRDLPNDVIQILFWIGFTLFIIVAIRWSLRISRLSVPKTSRTSKKRKMKPRDVLCIISMVVLIVAVILSGIIYSMLSDSGFVITPQNEPDIRVLCALGGSILGAGFIIGGMENVLYDHEFSISSIFMLCLGAGLVVLTALVPLWFVIFSIIIYWIAQIFGD
ncbi:MAG: hypothetical protein ACFFCS_20685 [Candidatus Hodarchaeota archaeon]